MSFRSLSLFLGLSTLLLGLPGTALGDEAGEKGRAVFEANKDAVVTVRAVVSMSYGGEDRERKNWGNGIVLDPSGLTVLSLSTVDPLSLFQAMGQSQAEVVSKVVSLHIMTAGDTEIPAEIVLRDKDLDLAYIRPSEAVSEPMASVDLEKLGDPKLLEQVAVIAQLGEVARRAHSVLLTRVETIVKRPRTYYVTGDDRAQSVVSSPVFTLDGGFVGMGAMRAIKSESQGGMGDNILVVVVPALDIKDGLTQVPPVGEEGKTAEDE